MWIAIFIGALALALCLYLGFRWLTGRAMFQPGTVAQRIRDANETLDPISGGDRWQVTSDVVLAHDSFGAGDDILFVHGGPGFPTRGRPKALALLSKSFRVHLYDHRGCGNSTRPFERAPNASFYQQLTAVESKLGLAEQIADIERIRRLLGRDRLILVGHSFGGLVAALYAAEFPDRVSKLVLVSPAPLHVMPAKGDLFALVREKLPASDRADFDAYRRTYFDLPTAMKMNEASLSKHYGRFRSFYASATGLAQPSEDTDVGGFMILATYASLGRNHDWRDALARIQARVLVLHGRSDLSPEAEMRDFASSIPNSTIQLIDAGHFALDDAPDQVAASIEQFVR